jgi:hypothetical protein
MHAWVLVRCGRGSQSCATHLARLQRSKHDSVSRRCPGAKQYFTAAILMGRRGRCTASTGPMAMLTCIKKAKVKLAVRKEALWMAHRDSCRCNCRTEMAPSSLPAGPTDLTVSICTRSATVEARAGMDQAGEGRMGRYRYTLYEVKLGVQMEGLEVVVLPPVRHAGISPC